MFPTEGETLTYLAAKDGHALRVWLEDFLTHGSPYKAPWPDRDESSAAKRLQLLADAPTADPSLRAVQDRIREAAFTLCAQYNATRFSARVALELLDFVHAVFSRHGALAFNQKLVDASLPWQEERGRLIWVEAHRVVSEVLAGDWLAMKPWITRDARLGDVQHPRDDPLRLRVAISALGVWARHGPMNTLSQLLELVTCASLHLRRVAQNSGEDAWALVLPRENDLLRHVASVVDRVGGREAESFSNALGGIFQECMTAEPIWRASLGALDRLELLPEIPAQETTDERKRWHRIVQAVERRVYKPLDR